MTKPLYITTTLPYVNGAPHIGTTTEFVRADVLARVARRAGREVFFNTGTDEHGQKIADKAKELGKTPQEYTDEMEATWKNFAQKINMSYDFFSRTTAAHHEKAAREIWRLCDENGYIYKKTYQAKYCVGCELAKTDSELNDEGCCEIHPNMKLELIDEENYFFKFSEFQEKLLALYEENPTQVVPDFRLQEIKGFVTAGLHDFSISRLKEKMSWGVPVPGDDEHVMYVWFDALTNYISCLGWGSDDAEKDDSLFKKFWQEGETIQLCGKDNLRQQSAIWQAMLMAAGLPNTQSVFVEGFINSNGQKMSKSLGNVINPIAYIEKYGIDAVRYFIVRHVHNVQDSDWTIERFHECYMANLVNGIGNLTNRILQMAEKYEVSLEVEPSVEHSGLYEKFDFNGEADRVWKLIGEADQYITDEAPFKKIKENPEGAKEDVRYLLAKLWEINTYLAPIMPETHGKIKAAMKENKKPTEPLFPRLEFEQI